MAKKNKETQEIKFEDAILRLEEIVQKLEDGKLNLDDSLKYFEEGVKLSRTCEAKLSEAKGRVEILMKGMEKAGKKSIEEENVS